MLFYEHVFASHTQAELTNKKKRGKGNHDKKALQAEALTCLNGACAEAKWGTVNARVADEPSAEDAAEQLGSSVPAEPNGPAAESSPDTAAHTLLPPGAAAATDAEADALPSSKEAATRGKKKWRMSNSQVAGSHADPANDPHRDYTTISSSMDMAKFQTQGYMSSSLAGDKCPLDCDMLVFPVPVGKQWACAVVDMRKRNIFYGSSLQVLFTQISSTVSHPINMLWLPTC